MAVVFFFEGWGQKLCPNLLIKKERIVQLINGKLDENRYKNTTNEQHRKHQPTSSQNLLQQQTDDHKSTTPQRRPTKRTRQLK
jgi:hypothetical protein